MTLADKLNWLIDRAWWTSSAAQRGCAEVAAQVERVTGEPISHTTIWKPRNGKDANPQMRLIEMLALTFGVPAGFFFDDFGAGQARGKPGSCNNETPGCLHWSADRMSVPPSYGQSWN
jgi:transcriptional regulator with XRE-family HTH domain